MYAAGKNEAHFSGGAAGQGLEAKGRRSIALSGNEYETRNFSPQVPGTSFWSPSERVMVCKSISYCCCYTAQPDALDLPACRATATSYKGASPRALRRALQYVWCPWQPNICTWNLQVWWLVTYYLLLFSVQTFLCRLRNGAQRLAVKRKFGKRAPQPLKKWNDFKMNLKNIKKKK